MSNFVFFKLWLILVPRLIFQQTAEAGQNEVRDRAVLTFNYDTDPCYALREDSEPDTKDFANGVCVDSFNALDSIDGNLCNGWRRAKCRILEGLNYFQCTCVISTCDDTKVRGEVFTSYRDCAWRLYTQEILDQQKPSTSAKFQRLSHFFEDDAKEKSRLRRSASTSLEAGPSRTSPVSRAGGSSSGTGSTHGGSTSQAIGIPSSSRSTPKRATWSRKRKAKTAFPEKDTPGIFACDECDKTYHCMTSLISHKVVHKEDVRCETCDWPFSRRSALRNHMRRAHPQLAKIQEEEAKAKRIKERPFACDQCDERYKAKKQLQEHMPLHRGETKCEFCNIVFPRKSALNLHKKKEHKDRIGSPPP